jgi:predicted ATPase
VDSALYPIIVEIERSAGLQVGSQKSGRLDRLEALLKNEGLNLERVVPLLASLLSIELDDRYSPPDPDPQRRKELILDVLVERLASLARRLPVVMIVEDVHWADPTTLDFFGRAMLRLRKIRIFLIMTYRPEFKIAWTRHAHVTALTLNRLGHKYCRAMIESIASCGSLPPAVMEQIIAKTDGVPLFVEELTKTVLESGLLAEIRGARVFAGPLPEFAIPATLQDSLLARLDRLNSVKEVAQLGAAIGREFSYSLLNAVLPMPEGELKSALNRLVGAELVFAHGTPPAATYVFKHALVQDTAYETLLKSKRQQLHSKIASVIEDRFPEVMHTQRNFGSPLHPGRTG